LLEVSQGVTVVGNILLNHFEEGEYRGTAKTTAAAASNAWPIKRWMGED
jgi:hypothetical protein